MKTSELSSEDDETSWAYDSTAGGTKAVPTSEIYKTNTTGSPPDQTFVLKPSKFAESPKFADVGSGNSVAENPKTKSIKKLVNYAELLVRRTPKVKRYHHSSLHSQDVSTSLISLSPKN
jgi:hypothetical protein